MKNKIDELFKANASQGHFAYKDAYWAHAEKLLNNSPKGGGISSGIIATASVLIIGAAVVLSLVSNASSTKNNIKQNAAELSTETLYNENTSPITNNNSAIESRNISIENQDNRPQDEFLGQSESTELAKQSTTSALEKSTKNAGQISVTTPTHSNNEAASNMAKANKNTGRNNKVLAAKEQTHYRTNNEVPSEAALKQHAKTNDAETTIAQISAQAFATDLLADNALEETDFKNNIASPIAPFKTADNFTFNVGADFGYYFLNRSLQAPNQDYTDFRNNFEAANNMTSLGVNLQIGYGNWLFNTGIYQTKINETIQYPTSLLVNVGVDNGSWNVNDIWTYAVDSSWVIDSIYTGHWGMDTAWALDYDSTYVAQWDSVKTEQEMPELAKNNGKKTLSYVEIPIWFGRSFGSNKIAFDVQGGFALGFLTQTSGSKYINNNLTGLSEGGVEQYNKLLFSVMLRTGLRFEIMPRWEASIYPSVRYTLNSVLQNEAIKQRYFSYGINLGLSYRF